MTQNMFYSLEAVEKYFNGKGTKIHVKQRINADTFLYCIHRLPENAKPHWLWYALRFKQKDKLNSFKSYDAWRILCMSENHINGIYNSRNDFFKWYDKDNALRLVPRFEGDKNVVK